MKVPFSWLKELVDIDVTAQELEEKLFSCGFEVEELIPLDAGISKVVVGKIVEMEKQEGTHLTKCVVDCGDYGHEMPIVAPPCFFYGYHSISAAKSKPL